jgi:hypothetical protein
LRSSTTEVERQAYDTLNGVVADAKGRRLAPIVVIEIRDNGVIEPSQLNSTLQLLHSKTRVVLRQRDHSVAVKLPADPVRTTRRMRPAHLGYRDRLGTGGD